MTKKKAKTGKNNLKKVSRYAEELGKFAGDEVTVVDVNGTKYDGVCLTINPMHLNIVIMDEATKTIIKNPQTISRKRNKKEWKDRK